MLATEVPPNFITIRLIDLIKNLFISANIIIETKNKNFDDFQIKKIRTRIV